MKQIPMIFNQEMVKALLDGRKTVTRRPVKNNLVGANKLAFIRDYSPYQVGDLIWVRETFQMYAEDEIAVLFSCKKTGRNLKVSYPATDALVEITDDMSEPSFRKWPSIHMPKWASRLTLRITDVRVERLHEVTVDQALQEGIAHHSMNCPIAEYGQLWNKLYGTWGQNPWVWVIEFEVIHKNMLDLVKEIGCSVTKEVK